MLIHNWYRKKNLMSERLNMTDWLHVAGSVTHSRSVKSSVIKGLSVMCGGGDCAMLWLKRKRGSVLFLYVFSVMRSQTAAVAPIITSSLFGVWVDGCADLSVPFPTDCIHVWTFQHSSQKLVNNDSQNSRSCKISTRKTKIGDLYY